MPRLSIFLVFLISTACTQAPSPDNPEAEARVLREGELTAFVKDWGGKDAGRIPPTTQMMETSSSRILLS